MNETRINNIKKAFEGMGPVATKEYTNQEIVDLLQNIQKMVIAGVYEQTHAEYMRERDLMLHFSTLAEEYGLKGTSTYQRFETNMADMGYTIGSFIKGMKGERIARKALKLMSYDKDVKILYNVALEDEDLQAEYDAIVIAPYGLFVVEVKNWGAEMYIDTDGILRREDQDIKYDLPGRMGAKEALLREYLGESFPEKYQGVVLFSNENAKVVDEYTKIPLCYGGGIVNCIREFDDGKVQLTGSQIYEISDKIISHHKEQKAPCRIKCEEIIEDYALLMAAIEEAAEGSDESIYELKHKEERKEAADMRETEKINIPYFLTKEYAIKQKQIEKIAIGTASVVAGFGLGILAAKSFLFKK